MDREPALIWNLLLAHLLADFPLQPMWLVRSKERTWGLVVHGAVHFLTTLLLVGAARATVWPHVLALAVFHFTVDVVKYRLGITRPLWAIVSYFVDQGVHLASLAAVAVWIGSAAPEAQGLLDPMIAIYAGGYLIATHVWYVTEKTISHDRLDYRVEIELTLWPRMLVRAGLLTLVLYLGSLALPAGERALALVVAALGMPLAGRGLLAGDRSVLAAGLWIPLTAAVQLPYRRDRQWRRALVTDLIVVGVTATLVLLAATSI